MYICAPCECLEPLETKVSARPVSSGNRFCVRAESLTGEGLSLFLYYLFSLCFLLGYHVKFQVVLTVPQWTWKQRLLFFFNHFVLLKFNPNNITHKIRVYDRSLTMKARISLTYSSLEELRTISLLMREGWGENVLQVKQSSEGRGIQRRRRAVECGAQPSFPRWKFSFQYCILNVGVLFC